MFVLTISVFSSSCLFGAWLLFSQQSAQLWLFPGPRDKLKVKANIIPKRNKLCLDSEVPNGCDPNTAIGGFLLFPALRAWCEENGATEFGAFGKK